MNFWLPFAQATPGRIARQCVPTQFPSSSSFRFARLSGRVSGRKRKQRPLPSLYFNEIQTALLCTTTKRALPSLLIMTVSGQYHTMVRCQLVRCLSLESCLLDESLSFVGVGFVTASKRAPRRSTNAHTFWNTLLACTKAPQRQNVGVAMRNACSRRESTHKLSYESIHFVHN